MDIDRRIMAFMIDFPVSIFLGMFVFVGGYYLLEGSLQIVQSLGVNSVLLDSLLFDNTLGGGMFSWVMLSFWSIGWPSLFLGSCSHIFGKSIGKWIVGLKIVDFQGNKPRFGTAISRELLKISILYIPFLWLLPLIQLLNQGSTFYDQLFGTVVKGKPKLTAVQKKYQAYLENR